MTSGSGTICVLCAVLIFVARAGVAAPMETTLYGFQCIPDASEAFAGVVAYKRGSLLGTSFAGAQNIRYQSETGELTLCHTTSWGVSTRLIGGVIMTHGDDDGLRLPPAIAPRQVVIVPILRDKPEDEAVLAYAEALSADLAELTAFRAPVRVLVDRKPGRSGESAGTGCAGAHR